MADRDFDAEFSNDEREGHSFTLGGKTFHTPAVAPPGAFLEGGRGLVAAVRFLRRVVLPEERSDLERVIESKDASAALIDAAPELFAAAVVLLAAAETGQNMKAASQQLKDVIESIKEAEESAEPGPLVSAEQLDTVAEWLMEATVGRPTISPSRSSNGAGRTSNGSKVTSSKAGRGGKT